MRYVETILWSLGFTLLLIFFGTQVWGEIERQRGIAAFSDMPQLPIMNQAIPASLSVSESKEAPPATELLEPSGDAVLALLRIADIRLELPVRYGTDERVLRRGPGLIEGSPFPGSNGNVAIAAHRDLHFRGLKDLELGDLIELEVPDHTQTYIITDLSVVEPSDVHVLDEIGQPALTLVTCYPFYFVGNAPERFIVRAEAAEFFH